MWSLSLIGHRAVNLFPLSSAPGATEGADRGGGPAGRSASPPVCKSAECAATYSPFCRLSKSEPLKNSSGPIGDHTLTAGTSIATVACDKPTRPVSPRSRAFLQPGTEWAYCSPAGSHPRGKASLYLDTIFITRNIMCYKHHRALLCSGLQAGSRLQRN